MSNMSNTRPPKFKCIHCSKFKIDHNQLTDACPIGIKKQGKGYLQFHDDNVFTPDLSDPRYTSSIYYLI